MEWSGVSKALSHFRGNGRFIGYLACFSLIFFFVFCIRPAFSQDLIELYGLAQKNDPTIQGAGYEYEASREVSKQAWSSYFPVLTAQGEYIDTSQDIVSSDNTVFATGQTDFSTETYTLTLTQPILNWGSVVRIGQANAEKRQADMEYELAKQDLMIRVAERYLTALGSRDNLDFTKAELIADEGHFELAEGLHRAGRTPITDLHDAKARLTSVKARTIESENLLDDAMEALREICGEEIGELSKLKREFPLVQPDPPDVEVWVKAALDQNLGIQVQKHAAEVADREVSRQRAGHWPTIDAVARHNNRNTDGTLFGGGSEVETTEILVQANLNLFQGLYVVSKVREAKKIHKAALKELERVKREAKRQARAAYLGVQSAISRVKALNESLVAHGLAVDAKQYGFRSGLYTSLAILDAERDLQEANREYARARYEYILNTLRLRQAVGTLSEQDLLKTNQWFN